VHQAAQIFCASNRKHMSQRPVASNASAACPLTSHQLIPLFACLLLITCHFSSVCLSLIAFNSFSCWAAASLTATVLLQNRLLVVCRLEAEQTQHDQRKMHTKCANECKSVVPQDSRKGQMRINKGQQVPMHDLQMCSQSPVSQSPV
jgi:L-asparagine transporter-like permease